MSFKRLRRRVEHAEHLVDVRSRQTLAGLQEMNRTWRAGWTPIRIILAGLATGFVAGRAEPMSVVGRLGEIRWAQIISIVSTLVAGIQTMVAGGLSAMSEQMADAEDFAAQEGPAAGDASASGSGACRDEDVVAPRPAEAATELASH